MEEEKNVNEKTLKTAEDLAKDLENELSKNRSYWSSIISELTGKMRGELKDCLILEAESVSRRQELTETIAKFSYKIFNDNSRLKILRKEKFEYYATKYQIKTNASEKTKLIDADLAWYDMKVSILENFVEFLIETRKTMDHIIWSVKNKIQLYNITGMEG